MGRAQRRQRQSGFHHVMNRGAGRRAIFHDDRDRVEFGTALGEACRRSGVEVHAYCLMPNHFHLLVNCPDGGLSEALQWLSAVYTRRFNQRMGSDGPILRGRFRSKPVDTDEYLVTAVRYIHRNALSVIGDAPLDSYRWSSLRTYLGYRRAPDWLRTDLVLDHFGGDRSTFADFHDPWPAEHPPINVATIADLAEFALEEFAEDAPVGPKLARTVMLLAADELGPLGEALIANLGFESERRALQARSRARARAATDPFLRHAALRIARDTQGVARGVGVGARR
jgi:REP element-mobilizing transposase RayT